MTDASKRFWLSLALIGVVMHVLLAGAVWPSEEKLAGFMGDAFRGDS